MSRIVFDKRAVCLHCNYPLHRLGSCRCPECGREFVPGDPRTYDGPHQAQQTSFPMGKAAQLKIGIALAVCLIVLVIGEWLFTGKLPDGAMFYLLSACFLIFLFCVLFRREVFGRKRQ